MTSAQTDEIVGRIEQDMRQAMTGGEGVTAETFKTLLAHVSNAEVVQSVDQMGSDGAIAGTSKGVGSSEARRKVLTISDIHSKLLLGRVTIVMPTTTLAMA